MPGVATPELIAPETKSEAAAEQKAVKLTVERSRAKKYHELINRIGAQVETTALREIKYTDIFRQEAQQQAPTNIEGVSRTSIAFEDDASGDYSALKKTKDGMFGVIEDFAGHGIQAAALRKLGHMPIPKEGEATLQPDEYIRRLDKRMMINLNGKSVVAAGAFEVNKKTRQIRFAGRFPLMLLIDGKTKSIKAIKQKPQPSIGKGYAQNVEEQTFTYEQGDALLIGTDGVYEVEKDKKLGTAGQLARFTNQLTKIMDENPDLSAEQLKESILKKIQADGIEDDITLIAIQL